MAQQNVHDYWIVCDDVDYSDSAGAFTVAQIPAYTLVLESGVIIKTAFAGTSPTVDLGISTNDDVFVDNTDVTQGTAGIYWGDGDDASYYTGHWFSSDTNVLMTLGGTSLTAGNAVGVIHCVNLAHIE